MRSPHRFGIEHLWHSGGNRESVRRIQNHFFGGSWSQNDSRTSNLSFSIVNVLINCQLIEE